MHFDGAAWTKRPNLGDVGFRPPELARSGYYTDVGGYLFTSHDSSARLWNALHGHGEPRTFQEHRLRRHVESHEHGHARHGPRQGGTFCIGGVALLESRAGVAPSNASLLAESLAQILITAGDTRTVAAA